MGPTTRRTKSGDFYLATTGDSNLATSGDFFMATDRGRTVAYIVWNISQSCMVGVTKAWATALPTGRGRTAHNPT
jgi:hypothetical protein